MKVYGKVHEVLKKERIISIEMQSRLEYFHMTNKNMKDFKSYLFNVSCNSSNSIEFIVTFKLSFV